MAAHKPTQAENEARVAEVYKMLVAGAPRAAILQHAAEKWELATRAADALIAKARKHVIADARPEREFELARAIARLNFIYNQCVKVTDYGRAIAAQREMNQLLGLYAEPAAQTLKVIGMNHADMQELVALMDAAGMEPAEFFAKTVARLKARKEGAP